MKFLSLLILLTTANAHAQLKTTFYTGDKYEMELVSETIESTNTEVIKILNESKWLKCNWITTKIGGIANQEMDGETKYCHPINFRVETNDITDDLKFAELEKKSAQNIDCGKSVKIYVSALNMAKELSEAQVQQQMVLYADIVGLLDAGAMDSVRGAVAILPADGTLITSDDKTKILAKIDSCKAVF